MNACGTILLDLATVDNIVSNMSYCHADNLKQHPCVCDIYCFIFIKLVLFPIDFSHKDFFKSPIKSYKPQIKPTNQLHGKSQIQKSKKSFKNQSKT